MGSVSNQSNASNVGAVQVNGRPNVSVGVPNGVGEALAVGDGVGELVGVDVDETADECEERRGQRQASAVHHQKHSSQRDYRQHRCYTKTKGQLEPRRSPSQRNTLVDHGLLCDARRTLAIASRWRSSGAGRASSASQTSRARSKLTLGSLRQLRHRQRRSLIRFDCGPQSLRCPTQA